MTSGRPESSGRNGRGIIAPASVPAATEGHLSLSPIHKGAWGEEWLAFDGWAFDECKDGGLSRRRVMEDCPVKKALSCWPGGLLVALALVRPLPAQEAAQPDAPPGPATPIPTIPPAPVEAA